MSLSRHNKREKRTVRAMIRIYCHAHHKTGKELCAICSDLLIYAERKIDRCTFKEKKPVCSECKIHCYSKDNQTKIKEVMKYAGPRMIYKQPYFSLMHFFDKIFKKNIS